jgi:hypothetical protein
MGLRRRIVHSPHVPQRETPRHDQVRGGVGLARHVGQRQPVAHDGDPVLAWMLGNVVGHYDAKENVYPRKERPENKIDGAVALIMALGRHMVREPPPSFQVFFVG